MRSESSSQQDGPFVDFLGVTAILSNDGTGKATMLVREDHLQAGGVVQGGLIAALADYALYLAVQSLISAQQMSVTVEMNVNFVSPGNYGRTLTAESNVVSRGNSIMVGEMAATDDQGKLIAKGLGTCMVRSRE